MQLRSVVVFASVVIVAFGLISCSVQKSENQKTKNVKLNYGPLTFFSASSLNDDSLRLKGPFLESWLVSDSAFSAFHLPMSDKPAQLFFRNDFNSEQNWVLTSSAEFMQYSSEAPICVLEKPLLNLMNNLQTWIYADSLEQGVRELRQLPSYLANANSCKLARTLTCLKNALPYYSNLDLNNELNQLPEIKGQILQDLVANLPLCSGFVDSNLNSGFDFRVGKNYLTFFPSPLYSVSIYEGEFSNYDDALVQKEPVAYVPAAQNCSFGAKACHKSPLPIAQCKKCENLKLGKKYTAFLLTKPFELNALVASVVFDYKN